jgi:hypothetical protein
MRLAATPDATITASKLVAIFRALRARALPDVIEHSPVMRQRLGSVPGGIIKVVPLCYGGAKTM